MINIKPRHPTQMITIVILIDWRDNKDVKTQTKRAKYNHEWKTTRCRPHIISLILGGRLMRHHSNSKMIRYRIRRRLIIRYWLNKVSKRVTLVDSLMKVREKTYMKMILETVHRRIKCSQITNQSRHQSNRWTSNRESPSLCNPLLANQQHTMSFNSKWKQY